MTTYTYEKVSRRVLRKGKCPVCGKSVQRSRVFWQTVNPFNRRADGSAKTHAEVVASVQAEAAAWEPDFTHEACAS